MLSQAEENYIKTIFAIESELSTGVSTNLIAEKMQTKASSVTDMLQKLAEKKLVDYRKYQGVKLSGKGKKMAASIVRRHRLWETFLVEKLHFSWDEIHDVAEQLEHIQSEKLIDQLDDFLGFPRVDPHGDPIPDKDGNITKRNKVKLSSLKENEESILLSVKNASDDFLRYLDTKNIALGSSIKIIAIEPFDGSVEIETNSERIIISAHVAENLYLKNLK
ncbi:MAG: metal-dependent transcriptional regulator [Flavobacteriaceae bacterium]|nr:metal-dependent transcriptional regulator [Flavobacteriaceae bacterium]